MGDYLIHHGIKGQRWGVRRYQNEDGSYTEAGKKRYSQGVYSKKEADNYANYLNKNGKYAHRYETGSSFSPIKKYHVEEYTGDPNNLKDRKTQDMRIKNMSSYSQEQAARDRQVYSKGASKRIEKRVFEDGSLQGARSKEADRIASFRRASKISSRVTPVTTAVATGLAVTNALINDGGMEKANAVRVSISAGILAGKIAHELAPMAVMALGGYSPSKRY